MSAEPALALSPFRHPGEAFAAVQLGLHVVCRPARDPGEVALHRGDHHDDDPATVHVLGLCGDVAGGTVRLYPLMDAPIGYDADDLEPGLWKGDRLAVLPSFRRNGLGAPLVRFAVQTAAQAGGRKMVAHIQPPNVGFFEYLGWYAVGEPVSFVGRPHQTMAIDLPLVLRRLLDRRSD